MQAAPARVNPNKDQHTFFSGTLTNLFPPGDQAWCTWKPPDGARERISACRWQHEIAPDTQIDHIQIFCRAKSRCRWQALDEALGLNENQRHWKPCSGIKHAKATWIYCGEEKPDATSRHGCPSDCWGKRTTPMLLHMSTQPIFTN